MSFLFIKTSHLHFSQILDILNITRIAVYIFNIAANSPQSTVYYNIFKYIAIKKRLILNRNESTLQVSGLCVSKHRSGTA